MKCSSCEKDAEYDSDLEYNTVNGMRRVHRCYCEEHMNLILVELLAYRKQYEFKIHFINKLDKFYIGDVSCEKR